ncbi:MAG: ADP-ribosylglycohydrolase family protein [Phycisphaeraceae bacterium]|nr:ADP-ribosylglycohydrolase family protein [Phycisphaeraceae bacterium]
MEESCLRLAGALYGGAIGDAIGAPVEGLKRQEILRLEGPVSGFIRPTERSDGQWIFCDRIDGKGDGRITDDTLMVEALIAAYLEKGAHLSAFDYREVFAPIVARRMIWLPEHQREMVLVDRLAGAEQLQIRTLLRSPHDPRFFGARLHTITCGAAMCAWPIGAVHAGDPQGAYDAALAFFAPQTYSFGLEQAAVMAAATAAALAPGATAQSVVHVSLSLARDATAEMIGAAVEALRPGADRDTDLPSVHAAVQPWHHKTDHVADHDESDSAPSGQLRSEDAGLESRRHTSEELPVALAMLLRADGCFDEAVCAGAEYGEDADSIAAMAGTLAGALKGIQSIPDDWRRYCDRQNRRDYRGLAIAFGNTIERICQLDRQRFQCRLDALAADMSYRSGDSSR